MNKLRIIRGIIADAVAGADRIVRCSVLGVEDEQIDDVEVFGAYGIDTVPPDGAECIAVQFGHRTVVVAIADRSIAPGGSTGEVIIHNSKDDHITLASNGDIEITSTGTVTIDASSIRLGGGAFLRQLIDERLVTAFNTHTHPDPVSGTSGPPTVSLMLANVSTDVVKGK